MASFKALWERVLNEELFVDDIIKHREQFNDYALKVISDKVSPNDPELEAFIRLCNDVYTYSHSGEVLISDSLYDQCMQVYKSGGNATIVYADMIGKKKWDFIKHDLPGAVGSLEKCYTYKEMKDYLRKYIGVEKFILSPKFDGISCAIKIENGRLVSAATRYNGIMGQNITELVKHSRNRDAFLPGNLRDGYYKCELCVGNEAFEELVTLKKYANRRSATAGIVNTPSNLSHAKFVTVIPLVYYDHKKKDLRYIAPYQKTVQYYSPADLMDDVEQMLEDIRSKDFPFRVDGIVINPDRTKLGDPNEFDLMDNSIAFKLNTSEGKTKIRYGYMSIGRLGRAMPMLKVEPVEVNETIVEDVSLGSYDKFLSMDLKENEEVIIFSAGDVIPQLKLPAMRANLYNSPELKIRRICPECGEKLTRVNTEYYCTNQDCPRIITGRISNFLIKMGIEGFSDRSVEMIYNGLKISNIVKFLNLTADDIMKVDGFDISSATSFANELVRIRNTPTSIPKFFGALGIDKISEKKCRKIFEYVNLDDLLSAGDKKLDKIFWHLQCSDGIGAKTARTFIDFIRDNRDEIAEMLRYIKLTGDIKFKNNVVFTGFRPSKDVERELNSMGIEVANSVSKSTLAVISATTERDSVKSKAAISKGIPIVHASELDNLLAELRQTQN